MKLGNRETGRGREFVLEVAAEQTARVGDVLPLRVDLGGAYGGGVTPGARSGGHPAGGEVLGSASRSPASAASDRGHSRAAAVHCGTRRLRQNDSGIFL